MKRDIKVITSERIETAGIRLTFSNGKVLEFVDCRELGEDVVLNALTWGIREKLTNAAALERNTETGRAATVEEKFSAVERVHEMLGRGLWTEREAGGGQGSLLLRALMQAHPAKTKEVLVTWLEGKTKAQQNALMLAEPYAGIIAAIRAKAAASIDAGDMLDELESL